MAPTLSDEAFLTEVHHVDGDGENAGVVYCEMQGRENTGESLAWNKLLHMVYGEPNECGLSSETGGKLKELRELDNATVRQYHQDYYRPENLILIVVGPVNASDVKKTTILVDI